MWRMVSEEGAGRCGKVWEGAGARYAVWERWVIWMESHPQPPDITWKHGHTVWDVGRIIWGQ